MERRPTRAQSPVAGRADTALTPPISLNNILDKNLLGAKKRVGLTPCFHGTHATAIMAGSERFNITNKNLSHNRKFLRLRQNNFGDFVCAAPCMIDADCTEPFDLSAEIRTGSWPAMRGLKRTMHPLPSRRDAETFRTMRAAKNNFWAFHIRDGGAVPLLFLHAQLSLTALHFSGDTALTNVKNGDVRVVA